MNHKAYETQLVGFWPAESASALALALSLLQPAATEVSQNVSQITSVLCLCDFPG